MSCPGKHCSRRLSREYTWLSCSNPTARKKRANTEWRQRWWAQTNDYFWPSQIYVDEQVPMRNFAHVQGAFKQSRDQYLCMHFRQKKSNLALY